MERLKRLVAVLFLQWAAACGGDGGTPGPIAPPAPANRAPTATGTIPVVTLEAGEQTTVSVSGAFTDPDGDALTYAAASDAAGVVAASVSGSTVTVTGVAPGSATVTVTATDPGGRSATQTFGVTVTSANREPAASGTIPDQSVAVGAEATVDVSGAFTDPDGDALTYAAESGATGVATVSISGSTVTVTGVAPGSATVTVTATDPGDLSATQTFTVTVTGVNLAPEASGTIPDQSVAVGAEATVDVSGAFTDPDGDALTYAAESGATGVAMVSISGSTVTVTGVAPGSATVTVTATDPGDLSATQTFGVTVTSANLAPEASGTIPDQSVAVGAEATVDVSGAFTDPDGDALTYAAESGATGVATVSISGSTVTVTGVAPGSATVTVTATDPGDLSATQTFGVTVTSANLAPEASGTIPDQSVAVGAETTVDVSGAFMDPDGDALTYAAESDPTGVVTVDVSGSEVTVTGVAPGSATVTVTATDPGDLSATQTFRVTVTGVNREPEVSGTIPDQRVAVGAEATVDVSGAFTDPDDDPLTYAAESEPTGVATVDVSGSEVTVTGVAPGSVTITVTATDPGDLSATQTFRVTVEATSGAPDLDALFVPPTAAEIAQVEAEWEMRAPEVSGVQVELDTEVTSLFAGTVRVRVLSHTVGGLRHYGLLVTPRGAAGPGSLPVIAYAHGGDDGVDLADILLIIPFLRSVGSVAFVAPSYRSEPLRVEDRVFISDGPPSAWDRDVDDTMSLLSVALEEAPELDGERIALLGLSRGGGVSLLTAARDTRIDAVVEAAGPTDLFDGYAREIMEEALAGTLRDLPGLDYLNETVIQPWQRGELSDADARIEMLRRSAAYFVGQMPPVQLHHGTADEVVDVSQAHRLIEEMEAAGKGEDEFEAHIYDGAGHGLLDLVSRGAATRAEEFLRTHIFGPG